MTSHVCRIANPGPAKTSSPSLPEPGAAPDAGDGRGNHQTRCAVLCGLEAHSLCGPEAGLSHEGAADHSREVAGASEKHTQLWGLLKLEIRMNVSWESGS